MKKQKGKKFSFGLLLILILLMVTFAFVQVKVFNLFEEPVSGITKQVDPQWGKIEDIKAAKGMYKVLKSDQFQQPTFEDKSAVQRSLKQFYALRAYPGAPPMIPHPISNSKSLTGDSCLGCHENGGYTPKYNAYAPVVPHPEKGNCRQCHNPTEQSNLFKNTNWEKIRAKRGKAHLPGSPLVIPHKIQMRENCLSCHSGPAAVKEIRTTHPERVNCMQCHVESNSEKIWSQK